MSAHGRVSSGREVARAYDAMAETYDEIDLQPFYISQYDLYAADLTARRASWRGRVLDLGCGTGIHTRAATEWAEHVVGCDVSLALVRKARAKLDGSKSGAVLVADGAALPFAGFAFDAVLSYGEPLSHMADAEEVLAELARVVVPAGRVVLSVDNEWNVRTLHPRRLWRAVRSRGGSVREWSFYDDGGEPVRLTLRTFTHRELARLLARHGFRIEDVVGVHVLTLLAPLATDARGSGWRVRLFLGLHRLDRRLGGAWPWNRFGYSKIVAAVRA